tara:strand:- start:15 stop:494 length:480 start_codon:yes stop_codon:yes gene_type:complete
VDEHRLYDSWEIKTSDFKKLTKKLGYKILSKKDGYDEGEIRYDMVKKLLRTKKSDLMIIGDEYRVMGRKSMLKVELIIGILQALPFGSSTSGITKRLQAKMATRKKQIEKQNKSKNRTRKRKLATCRRCGIRASSSTSPRYYKGTKVCSLCNREMQDEW